MGLTISVQPDDSHGVTVNDQYELELVVCERGRLELRDRNDPDRWISTDVPAEILR